MGLPNFLTNPDPELYRTGSWVAVDFETTAIEYGSALNPENRLVLACWSTSDGKHYYRFGGELDMAPLVAACNAADFIIAHNAKFELQWLERCGYDIGSRPVFCTMVSEWVLAGNRKWKLNLNACAERHSLSASKDQAVTSLIHGGVCPSDIPRSLLLRYCRDDVRTTVELYEAQLRDMDGTDLLPVVYTRCLVIPALADIERSGLHLDAERVEEAYRVAVDKYTKAMAEMDELTGGINPRSPTQVAKFVYGELGFKELTDRQGNPIRNKPSKQFPDGVPKCDETTLLSLRASTPEQTRFIELKKQVGKLSSLLDKNLSMFLGACRETEATIYGEVNQGRTVTHRTSSAGKPTKYEMFDKAKGCQFQNLPRKCKPLFRARRDGWEIAEADAPQLEFRVAGFLGNDETIIREVTEGYDVHTYTKDVISEAGGVAISRTEAKKHTFKPLYGGSSGTDAERAYYQAFNEKYHRLVEKQTDWCLEVEATKQLVTPWGFVFHWPNAHSLPIMRFNPETKRREEAGRYLNVRTNVVNAPIQSLATADIIPITLAYFWHRTRGEDWIIITNTIHDSIISEINPESRELFQKIVVQSFTEDVYAYLAKVYDMKFNVPLGVGIKIGTHWGELPEGEEEISVQVQPPA